MTTRLRAGAERASGLALLVGLAAGCGRTELLDPSAGSRPGTHKVCVRQIAAGPPTCALRDDGTVACWGENGFGQVGDGTTTDRARPTMVAGLGGGVVELAVGGYQSCARKSDGTVWCWGWGARRPAGALPARIDFGGGRATALATGSAMTCATLADGSLWCWAWGSGWPHTAPVRADFLDGPVTGVAIAGTNVCARKRDGSVWCWPWNRYEIKPDGSTVLTRPAPEAVPIDGATKVVMGCQHACTIRGDRTLWCWGGNADGQIGDGTLLDRPAPARVAALGADVADVAAGCNHTCAVTTDGTLSCWGANWAGQIGTAGSGRPGPAVVAGLPDDVAQVAAGPWYTCARTAAGAAFCWGANWHGELGDGTTADHADPRQVAVCGA